MIYHIGDVVLVKNGFHDCDAGYIDDMAEYFGQPVTITDISPWYDDRYSIAEDNGEWWWSPDCFDGLVLDEQCSIDVHDLI